MAWRGWKEGHGQTKTLAASLTLFDAATYFNRRGKSSFKARILQKQAVFVPGLEY
jgi:hypothetical protein